jgi:hypothetical protein
MLMHILQLALVAALCGAYGFILYRRRNAEHMTGVYGRIAGVFGMVLLGGSAVMTVMLVYTAVRIYA